MSAKRSFLSILGPSLTRYLALKEALGRRYAIERAVLQHLDAFLAVAAAEADLRSETFADWCRTQQHVTSGVRRNRMRIARNFCLYRRRTEPSCFVPDPHPLSSPTSRRTPSHLHAGRDRRAPPRSGQPHVDAALAPAA